LKKFKIKADFFIVGENAELHTDIIKRMYEIGNHTFTHPNIADTSPLRTKLELNSTQRLIQEVTGHSAVLFRPSYTADVEPYLASEILPILRAQDMNYIWLEKKLLLKTGPNHQLMNW
jgi:peptidoglycan-N-acetylglucosamine deacetylase